LFLQQFYDYVLSATISQKFWTATGTHVQTPPLLPQTGGGGGGGGGALVPAAAVAEVLGENDGNGTSSSCNFGCNSEAVNSKKRPFSDVDVKLDEHS
jgi:hypothetical protein